MRNRVGTGATCGLALALMLLSRGGAAAQERAAQERAAQERAVQDTLRLTLAEALARAAGQSEEIGLARAQVDLADAQVRTVRAGALPQINANFGYTRTFASQFDTGGTFELPDSLKFEPDSTRPLAERVSYLEDRTPGAGLSAFGDLFGNLPFGRDHAYAATVRGSQVLYSGGRVGAALEVASKFREAAALMLDERVAELELSVRTAYARAQLAHELVGISQAAVAQAEKFLDQERLRERSGAASELDVLRAEVALENLRPPLIQARNAAELALLEVRRLVNVPASQPVELMTSLEVPDEANLARRPDPAEGWIGARAAVQAAERQARMRELAVRIAKGAFLPSIGLQVYYGRLTYPASWSGLGGDWRTDWTATLGVEIPLFDGLRRNAQVDEAQVQFSQARLELAQLREVVQMQYQQAAGERDRAASAIAARQKTVTQAQRVYDLTVLRYDRGLATQLEVSDARLGLLQARTNLVQALADFRIAEATVARVLGRPLPQTEDER